MAKCAIVWAAVLWLAALSPAAAVTIQSIADGFIRSGSPTTTVNTSATMEVAARTGSYDRKIYLKYNLSGVLAGTNEARNAKLSLALASPETRLLGSEGGQVELNLYGIADNDDAWSENTITWNGAPHNDTSSGTALTAGAVLLATVRVDSSRVGALDRITWSSHELAQYLNWAAGRRGQRYVSGHATDSDRKVTFVIAVGNIGTSVPGFVFQRRQVGAAAAPKLEFDDVPPVAADAPLQNDQFSVTLQPNHSVLVREKATGAEATFAPRFQVVTQASSPGFSTTAITGTPQGGTTTNLNYTVPTWTGAGGNFALAPGSRSTLTANASKQTYKGINWTFPTGTGFALTASLEMPPDDGGPLITWTLTPTALSYFSVGYIGAPTWAFGDVDSIFQPMIWSGKRFPSKMYLTDESRCSLPVSFVQKNGVVTGLAVDPAGLSFRLSTLANSRYGLSLRDAASQLQPAVYAPLYGGSGSNRSTAHSFKVRLIVRKGDISGVFRELTGGLYGFYEQRQNLPGGSLNTALDNFTDFLLNTSGKNYSYWSATAKANDYVNDQPGYARFQSAVSTLGLALVRDDAAMYADRALPTIEYFASRRKNLFKISGYDPDYPMGGPVNASIVGDWATLGAQTGGRLRAWEPLGVAATYSSIPLLDRIDHTATYDRATALDLAKRWLRPLTAYYRATGDPAYLADATSIADQYIAGRIEQPPVDFRDTFSSFWTEIAPMWDALFELYEVSGATRYRDAAVKALDEFILLMQFGPSSPPGTVTVDGSAIPAWRVSEVGLYSEAAGTSDSHRAILMPYVAPYLARAARLTGDPFYATLAKANIVGRYLNYPGYTMRDSYTTVIQSATYPLRYYSSYVNTAHMNHPSPLAAMIVDYLIADAERGSQGAVSFPSLFSDTGAYFKQRVYGHAAGRFYGEEGVWPWLPRKLLSFTGSNAQQINYVTGRGNGRLYAHLSNQCPSDVTVTLKIDPTWASWTTGARVRLWRPSSPLPDTVLGAGSVTVTVPGDGFLALAIDGVTPKLQLQPSVASQAPRLPSKSYYRGSAAFGSNVGFVFSLSPARQHAYVYTDASPSSLTSATLHYRIDNGAEQTLTKSGYPFEFSVPLPSTATSFTYSIEGGPGQTSTPVTLSLVPGTVPERPGNFRTESLGETSAGIFWSPSAGADGYRLERRGVGDADFTPLAETPAPADHLQDANLAGNSPYQYRLNAFNDEGSSPWTAESSVRTDSPFEGWSRGFFGVRNGTGAAADQGDADGDGCPNLVEYALGTSPLLNGRSISLSGKSLSFSQIIRPDVSSRLLISEDLQTWQEAAVAAPGQNLSAKLAGYSLTPNPGSPGWFTITPPVGQSRLFYKWQTERAASPP